MKRFLLPAIALLLPFWLHAQETPAPVAAAPLKLLTVGNSFADNSMSYFSKLAESHGKKVKVYSANLGGCTLERHVRHLTAYEANPQDPEGSPYSRGPGKPNYSLRQALELDTWDYVTIQQASPDSYKPETFEPFAGTLVAYIRKYAPKSKILILQTWAYREDFPGYKDGFNQEKMYDGLRKNYEKLAADYSLQMVPVGYAFQAARAVERWHFKPDPTFDYKNPPAGVLPKETGSLNIGWFWTKPDKDGKSNFSLDFKHGNEEGRYLAGSVFYETLFGDDVQKCTFVPDKVDAKDAAELRRIAHEAAASFPGPKPAPWAP